MAISPDESVVPGDEMRSEYGFWKLHGVIRGEICGCVRRA